MWDAWKALDWYTIAWLVWIAWFITWETAAILAGVPKGTLTWHLRPFFLAHPLLWFVALGAWLWIGFHFLMPTAETLLLRLVRGF